MVDFLINSSSLIAFLSNVPIHRRDPPPWPYLHLSDVPSPSYPRPSLLQPNQMAPRIRRLPCTSRTIHSLHQQYGPVVRIGPQEISFASLSVRGQFMALAVALRELRFIVCSMFTDDKTYSLFRLWKIILDERKCFNSSDHIVQKVREFLNIVEEGSRQVEIYSAMLFYSLDNITHFLYGPEGATSALQGNKAHQNHIKRSTRPSET